MTSEYAEGMLIGKSGKMGRKKIAAVICNYNKCAYVTECIQSVLESVFQDFDLMVVDNASTDGSVEQIRRIYGDMVKLFVNKENLGGSGGFNTGIRYALEKGYEYVWCLDNDVLVDENAIEELYRFMEGHPEVGMCGSKVYHMEAPDYVQQFGINIVWEEYCCEAKYYNRLEDGTMPEVVYSDAVAACSVLVRTSLIREIGPLPEENFLYWDDTEWGFRCNRAGYKVASFGRSKVLHCMGAKKESVSTFPLYYSWRNWIRFFMKYTPEENWEGMCISFLRNIHEALHGRMGKAGEDIIRPIVHSDEKLKGLLRGHEKIRIFQNNRENQALEFAERVLKAADEEGFRLQVELISGHALDGVDATEQKAAEMGADISFPPENDTYTMVDDIFRLNPGNMGLVTYYVDMEGRIVSSPRDVFLLLSIPESRQLFLDSQKGLFLAALRKLHS